MCHENRCRYVDQLLCTVEPCLTDTPENMVIYMYDNADTLLGPECHLLHTDTSLFRKADAWLGPNSITTHTNLPL